MNDEPKNLVDGMDATPQGANPRPQHYGDQSKPTKAEKAEGGLEGLHDGIGVDNFK